jgi:KUP system potassium uptake protein
MLATTLLLYFAARRVWKWSRIRAGALCAIPIAVEGAFFTGNSLKVFHGGWLPLAINRCLSGVRGGLAAGALMN